MDIVARLNAANYTSQKDAIAKPTRTAAVMSGSMRLIPHRERLSTGLSRTVAPIPIASPIRIKSIPRQLPCLTLKPCRQAARCTILRTMHLALAIGSSHFGASISIDSACRTGLGELGNSRFGASISIDSACQTGLGE